MRIYLRVKFLRFVFLLQNKLLLVENYLIVIFFIILLVYTNISYFILTKNKFRNFK